MNFDILQKILPWSFTKKSIATLPNIQTVVTASIGEFFTQCQSLLFPIPKFGKRNSHEYPIKTSQAYVGENQADNDTTQALIDEVTQLRQENLDLQQQLISGSL